jgi:hypothetical protein
MKLKSYAQIVNPVNGGSSSLQTRLDSYKKLNVEKRKLREGDTSPSSSIETDEDNTMTHKPNGNKEKSIKRRCEGLELRQQGADGMVGEAPIEVSTFSQPLISQ